MIHFEGDRSFALPLAQVFAKLSDARFLVSCLQGAEDVVVTGPDRATWKLHPAFSFVRSTLDITMDIVGRVPDSKVQTKIFSRGIGATATVLTALDFRATDAGTSIHWSADISEVTGLLKLVPKGLMASSAKKVIDDAWVEIEKKMI